jgi:hypothetical protein
MTRRIFIHRGAAPESYAWAYGDLDQLAGLILDRAGFGQDRLFGFTYYRVPDYRDRAACAADAIAMLTACHYQVIDNAPNPFR